MHSKTIEMNSRGSFCLWVIITLINFLKYCSTLTSYDQWMPLDCSAVNGSKVSEVVSTVATFKCPDPQLDLLLDCPAVNAQLTFCQIVTGVYF